jgi:hypothetical protein
MSKALELADQWKNSMTTRAHVDAGNAMADELIRQHAEIEALKADRDSWMQQASDRVADAVAFAKEADGLRAEIEALRKEADRWREWRKGKPLTVEIPTPTEEKPNRRTTVIFGPNHEPNYGEALDAAIDASMGEKA